MVNVPAAAEACKAAVHQTLRACARYCPAGRQAALVSALASSLSSVVSAADISVTSVTQPASFRRSLLWEAEPLDGSWEPERRKVTGGSLFGSSRPVDFSPCADADEKAALFGVRKFQVQAAHNLNLQGHQVPLLQGVCSLPVMILLWEPCPMMLPMSIPGMSVLARRAASL